VSEISQTVNTFGKSRLPLDYILPEFSLDRK